MSLEGGVKNWTLFVFFLARASGVFVRSPGMRNGMEWWIEVETNKKQLSELQKLAKIELFLEETYENVWKHIMDISVFRLLKCGQMAPSIFALWDSRRRWSRKQRYLFREFLELREMFAVSFNLNSSIPYHCACQGDRRGIPEVRLKKKKHKMSNFWQVS